jgi:uncharacterized protein (DUF952 family)
MPVIYHVTTAADWATAQQKGIYEHPSLSAEGFIHCSQDHQVAGVLERYFAGQSNLIKLVIDTDKLTSKFVFDWSPTTQDTFPHVYGPVNCSAVTDVIAL